MTACRNRDHHYKQGKTTQNAYPKNRRSGMPFSSRKGSESASRISISSPRGLPCLCAHSVVSVWPHGLQPARLLCPWDFSGQNTGASSRFLLQGIFPCQGSNPRLLCLPRWQADSLPLSHRGSPWKCNDIFSNIKFNMAEVMVLWTLSLY